MNNTLIIYFHLLIILFSVGYTTFYYKKHLYILTSIIIIGMSLEPFISGIPVLIMMIIYCVSCLIFATQKLNSLFLALLFFLIQNSLLILTWTVGYDTPIILLKSHIDRSPYFYYFFIYCAQLILLLLLIYFVYYINNRYAIWSQINKVNKKGLLVPLIIIFSNIVLLFFRQYLIRVDSLYHYLYLSIILFAFSVFIILTIFFVNKLYANKLFLDNLIKKSEENNHFVSLADEFQHDYKTFIYTSQRYLETNDIEGLKKYFNTLQDYSSDLFSHSLYNQVQKITDPAIQGLLLNGIEQSHKLGLELSLNIQRIPHDSFFSTIDFTRCLSILINNAIEHSTGKIYISFYSSKNTVYCSVKNTNDKPIQNDIFQKNFSTKKGHRGIGLSILSKTVRLYNNANLEVENNNNWISFTLSHKGAL